MLLLTQILLSSQEAEEPMMACFGCCYCLSILVLIVYFPLAIMFIAKKLGSEDYWWAWIPIFNIILLVRLAGYEDSYAIRFFVPILNIVAAANVWMDIALQLDKPAWYGIMMFFPGVNMIFLGMMAWG